MLLSAILLFFIGASIGSFLSVIVRRSHTGEKGMLWGRSQCPQCHKKLNAFELIPLISFFLQKGRCSGCNQKISFHYPLVELITGLLFVLLYLRFPFVEGYNLILPELEYYLWYGAFFSVLTAVAFSDALFMEFPIFLIMLAAVLGISIAFVGDHLWTMGTVWSLLLTMGIFGSQWLLSGGAWLGKGDLYLAFILAITLPFVLFIFTVFFAYISGALVAIILLISKMASKQSKIPFAPFLILGALLSVLFQYHLVFF